MFDWIVQNIAKQQGLRQSQYMWPWMILNGHFALISVLFGNLKPGFRSLASECCRRTLKKNIARFPCDSMAFLSCFLFGSVHQLLCICARVNFFRVVRRRIKFTYLLGFKSFVRFRRVVLVQYSLLNVNNIHFLMWSLFYLEQNRTRTEQREHGLRPYWPLCPLNTT